MNTASLRDWLSRAPSGTMVSASALLELLDAGDASHPVASGAVVAASWRERLWTCPDETRLGVVELAEAIGRPKSWVHRHTSTKSGYSVIPHAKVDGELVFRAGIVRTWLAEYERGEAPTSPAPDTPRVLSIGERATRRRR